MNNEIQLVRRLHSDAELIATDLVRERRKLMALIGGSPNDDPTFADALSAFSPRVIPHIIYDDVAGAIDWLQRAFGFQEREAGRVLDDNGAIGHAEMQVGALPAHGLIMLGPPSVHGDSPRRGVSAMCHVYVADVDRHFATAVAAGATIAVELADQPWGDRRYQATDPEGHQWHFAQRTR
jgi:PhnB protein